MSEQDTNNEELLDEILGEDAEEIPVQDNRRFNAEGERINVKTDDEKTKEPAKSPQVLDLENKLRAETERREAAEAKLVGVQARFDEVKMQMERETQEMRERMRKSLEDRARQGQSNFLKTLLPVLDNLNLAIQASEQDSSFEHLLAGVKGTAKGFEQALTGVGVEPVASVGAAFDPEVHEAVDIVETDPEQDGTITAEYARGYRFGSTLLRPARVQVGKAKTQTAGE